MNYPLRASRMHCHRSSTFWGGGLPRDDFTQAQPLRISLRALVLRKGFAELFAVENIQIKRDFFPCV